MNRFSDNGRGMLLMIGNTAAFTFSDACVKAIGSDLPLSQILVLRGIVASLFIAFLALRLGALRHRPSGADALLMLLRGVAECGSAYFFLTALRNMPLANATALLQMVPLTVTLGSAVFFGEPVGWRRWLAIAGGFFGMLLIVRPGTEGFTAFSVYALLAVGAVTLRDLATRRVSPSLPSMQVTLSSAVLVMLFAAGWSLGEDWQPLDARLSLLMLGTSLLIIAGYTLSVMVMRVGEVGFIAPFRYTGLLWALLLGLVIWGELPHPMTLLGAAVIVGMGSFTLWRERQLRRAGGLQLAGAKTRRT
ncbi:DMT family transporter [Alloyangia pacifica]|uniref:S-adenosylmethionine uptake transporter n=1 Tax=Alloyangia pacifica TaxID=311180 RepID=A0A1I6WN81_9RHOB|nr:DMT family transporter [Alloyangia pacifica]SDI93179.1 S-adenosylmethionine uptake transporter [Alloyangia pacifica]SFT27111.1 S-adenosylmethionine uptake transporter [Alloyangia pacifica]